MRNINIVTKRAEQDSMKEIEEYKGIKINVEKVPMERAIAYGNNRVIPCYPIRASIDNNGIYQHNNTRNVGNCIDSENALVMTKNIYELPDGIYLITKNDDVKIANYKVRLIEHLKIIEADCLSYDYYRLRIYCEADGFEETICVKIENYKEVFKIIKSRFPSRHAKVNMNDENGEYLTAVHQISEQTCRHTCLIADRGWFDQLGKVRYEPGIMNTKLLHELGLNLYDYSQASIPELRDLSTGEAREIFKSGYKFLSVGRGRKEIVAIYLFAHIGALIYWMESINYPCRFLLYIYGRTNTGKTSVAELITNVFERDHSKKIFRFSGTRAAVYEYISKNRDNVVLIDDYSHTEKRTQKNNLEIAELLLRAVGDGVIPAKMNNQGGVCHRKVRTAVMMTGETELELPLSSQLRLFSIRWLDNIVDKVELSEFQRKTDILRKYYALYLRFLTECGPKIREWADGKILNFRRDIAWVLEPRQVDIAVWFKIVIHVWREFGKWVGEDAEELYNISENFEKDIIELLEINKERCKMAKPSTKFVHALFHMIDNDKRLLIADNEDLFIMNEKIYLGFYTNNNELWLDFDSAYKFVKQYWRDMGEDFMSTERQVKESLSEAGLIWYARNSKGRIEYVKKAKKGHRRRMLVLYIDKCAKVMEEI